MNLNQKIAKYPLLFPLPAFLAGILVAENFPVSVKGLIIINLSYLLSCLFCFFLLRKAWLLLGSLAFLISFNLILIPENFLASQSIRAGLESYKDSTVSLSGLIDSPLEKWPSRIRFTMKAKKLMTPLYPSTERASQRQPELTKAGDVIEKDIKGTVLVSLYNFEFIPDLFYGDQITLKGIKITPPRSFNNPGNFDYDRYLRRQGIEVLTSVNGVDRIILNERPTAFNFRKAIFTLREKLLTIVEANFPSEEAQLLETIILGERVQQGSHMQKIFNNSGLAHLLSVSGLHVGFIAMLFYFILHRGLLLLRFNQALGSLYYFGFIPSRLASLLTILPIVFYTYLTGASIPTIRSAIMASTYLIAKFIGRDKNYLNILALAAWAILLWNPPVLFDIGFQLSFLAVGLLIWSNEYGLRTTKDNKLSGPKVDLKRPARLWQAIKEKAPHYAWVSTVASYGTLPLVGFYFSRVTPWAPLANMVTIPVASILVIWGTISLIISFFSLKVASLCFFLLSYITKITYSLTAFFASLPVASLPIPTPTMLSILAVYPFLACLVYLKRNKKLLLPCLFFFLIFNLSLFWKYYALRSFDKLSVTFLDVGQGDASFIKFPNGQNMMIDSGGTREGKFDIGQLVLLPYLRYNWIFRINSVVNSHAHPDHIRGFFSVLDEIKADRLWLNSLSSVSPLGLEMKRLAARKGIPGETVTTGRRHHMGDVLVEVLSPPAGYSAGGKNIENQENNSSLVIKLSYGLISFLFTGDIEKEGEKELLTSGEKLESTVLKIPHHGSSSSSTVPFLKMVSPKVGIVQVGSTNPFFHPHAKVLQRYADLGIQVYRTDMDGAVQMVTDGNILNISTFNQKTGRTGTSFTR